MATATKTKITLAKGGTKERRVSPDKIKIPDLWHVAEYLRENGQPKAADAVLDCWHTASDLLAHVREYS